MRVILANCEFEGPPCVSVFSRCDQLTLLQARDILSCSTIALSRHVCSNWLSREKGDVRSVEVRQGIEKELLFGARKPIFFKHARITLPVRSSQKNCYFRIYVSYFVFIFKFFILLLFISYLTLTYPFQFNPTTHMVVVGKFKWSEKKSARFLIK